MIVISCCVWCFSYAKKNDSPLRYVSVPPGVPPEWNVKDIHGFVMFLFSVFRYALQSKQCLSNHTSVLCCLRTVKGLLRSSGCFPELYRKLRETCGKNSWYTSSKSEPMVPSYHEKTQICILLFEHMFFSVLVVCEHLISFSFTRAFTMASPVHGRLDPEGEAGCC